MDKLLTHCCSFYAPRLDLDKTSCKLVILEEKNSQEMSLTQISKILECVILGQIVNFSLQLRLLVHQQALVQVSLELDLI